MKGFTMDLEEFRIPRQHFLVSAGAAVAATALAACASGDRTPAANGATESSTAADPASAGQPTVIVSTSDVPVGSGVIVGDIVVTQPTAGQFKGLSAKCTHKGCTVNAVADGTIDCPCHGSKFNLDGTVAHGPADRPLPTVNIAVQGDSIVAT
jgi:Rieske Fe-S protein